MPIGLPKQQILDAQFWAMFRLLDKDDQDYILFRIALIITRAEWRRKEYRSALCLLIMALKKLPGFIQSCLFNPI